MVIYSQDNRLPCRGLWLGMITKLDSLYLAPILNMYVRHQVIFLNCFWAKKLWIMFFWMISNGGSKLFTTPHNTPSLHPQMFGPKTSNLKCHWTTYSSKVISFTSFLSYSLANNCLIITFALTNADFRLDATWSMLTPLTLEPIGGGNGWS